MSNLPAFMESAGSALAVLTPLVVLPLTVFTFYLRSLREHQSTWHKDLTHRINTIESIVTQIRQHVFDFERDYTTKEEWLREEIRTRKQLDELKESSWRMEAAHGHFSLGHHKRNVDIDSVTEQDCIDRTDQSTDNNQDEKRI